MKARLRLTAEQFDRCVEVINDAFRMYHQLEDCLLRKARIHLNTIVFAERTFPSQITQLVDWAESRDKVPELLSWLRKCNGDNGDLVGLYNEFSTSDETLEKMVVQSTKLFVEPVQFREQMAAMERRVCRIEAVLNEVEVLATGFLVGPNLLLTNYHVIEDSKFGSDESKVTFRFNYKVQENGSVVGGSTATLANDWKVAWSITEEMDYAIVRLDRDVGRDPQGDFQGAPETSWIPLRDVKPVQSESLFILQHPEGGELVMAAGGLEEITKPWIKYVVNTQTGSSGAPVFNMGWELVALHSRAGQGQTNNGVLIAEILKSLPAVARALCTVQPEPHK